VRTRGHGGLHVHAFDVVDYSKDVIVTNNLIIEEDQDITGQGVDLHMGYPIQLGQLALQFAGYRGGALDFGDLDSDPSIKLVIVPRSMHRQGDSFLRDSSTY
jgi:hypothetical protein